jgi:putative acetyltransferase
MNIALESPDQPDVIALIAELDAYQDTLYPPECRYALDLSALKRSNVRFAVARDAQGRAVGCGALVLSDAFGEIKRMYVRPQHRGAGIARGIIGLLEWQAHEAACFLLALETGPRQPEALALYARCGYERTGPFGDYRDDPLSVFMQKRLDARMKKTNTEEASPMESSFFIARVAPEEEAALLPELGDVLIDCVSGGASVSFMAPMTHKKADQFWRGVFASLRADERVVLVARDKEGIVCGTVQLVFAGPENQPHRADIAKLLVHRRARRMGVASALMRAAEAAAMTAGKKLLVLDTVTGGAAEPLYAGLGWSRCGVIPDYALMPDGAPCATTVFYKSLQPLG